MNVATNTTGMQNTGNTTIIITTIITMEVITTIITITMGLSIIITMSTRNTKPSFHLLLCLGIPTFYPRFFNPWFLCVFN
ncbi:hypothetical protein [Helicobacter felistomachi]|uniref:hypothetical protein n=1 Tax=Helicobacter felistomachi TaxID=3040201 RepID=UPI002574611A|nr:hypothetical protein [Helicobacter sp. NHP21005]